MAGMKRECLLTQLEVSERLSISETYFQTIESSLLSRGLQRISLGEKTRYREASLDKLIQALATTDLGK